MLILKDYLKTKLRTGKMFKSFLRELKKSEEFSKDELQNYHNEKLCRIIELVYKNVPYYRNVMNEHDLTPKDIRSVSDLQRLPLINKDIVRNNFEKFRNIHYKGPVFKGLSSGTTGRSSVYLRGLRSINFENAVLWRLYQKAGKRVNSRRVTLRGEIPCPVDQMNPPFWRQNHFSKELLMSSFHLNEVNMPSYIDAINKYKPYDLHAYPASAYLLAEYCLRHNRKVHFKAIFTSSETLLPQHRQVIENAFKGKIYDIYGQAERVCMITQNEHGKYHIVEDYSIVELFPAGDGKYEIVGTNFNNYLMPLIRYRTGDIIELEQDEHGDTHAGCFRSVKNILGREDVYIETTDGRKLGTAALSMIPKGVDHIIESQFVQNGKKRINFRVVCTRDFSDKDEKKLLNNTYKYIPREMDVMIEKVQSIPRSKSGKFLLVVKEKN